MRWVRLKLLGSQFVFPLLWLFSKGLREDYRLWAKNEEEWQKKHDQETLEWFLSEWRKIVGDTPEESVQQSGLASSTRD